MNCAQLIFSPTGGTLRVANAITGTWKTDVETVDLTDPGLALRTFQTEDLVLIAVPSYGGRVTRSFRLGGSSRDPGIPRGRSS